MKTRKTNKGKRVSNHCKNHGSCPACKGNRLYQVNKQIDKAKEQIGFQEAQKIFEEEE